MINKYSWLDEWGACKVCGGEIPHGHALECDLFKMEQQIRVMSDALTKIKDGLNSNSDDCFSLASKTLRYCEDLTR